MPNDMMLITNIPENFQLPIIPLPCPLRGTFCWGPVKEVIRRFSGFTTIFDCENCERNPQRKVHSS